MIGRRVLVFGATAWGLAGAVQAQSLGDLIGAVSKSGALSQSDASAGLKEALSKGVVAATLKLGKVDGFYKDSRFHIPLPGSLAKAQKTLRPLGMSGTLDELELKMNRAAEQSMPAAKTLFLNAVKSITITDAVNIVRGGDTAGTQFLRGRTEGDLTGLLRPKMETGLQKTGAFGALDRASRNLNAFGGAGLGANLKGQVIDFAVAKTLDGAFGYIADEERDIRHNPVKRSTALLKKVFG
jgi:hypothetical protein